MTAPTFLADDGFCLPGKELARLAGRWALLLLVTLSAMAATAQTVTPAPVPAAAPAKTIVAQAFTGPGWTELSPAQRDILQPLASAWPSLSQSHKRKWLEMARSYGSLPADEQTKMQGRMKEWVALSPQQRIEARLNFAKTKELSKELTAEEKKAKWEAYQSLSSEEKQKLADKAPAKPAGAAPASKPVAKQKLATIPSAADQAKAKAAPKIAVSQSIDTPPGLAPAATPAGPNGTPAQPQ
ncbi:hypothetical protein GCM10011496_21080 [Polaromonas eurypsychrophila]|uniref:DUF3106 domain-containing protein n=1 Tax=Polaromonas eurypsychrophila TaxID=1614635 RepID=A0A916SGS8_9BURK|nr:DUF3106 domain-containing protein [Polaromonas eurypsychrophila]GGA99820.1 hypothetical protein GCM10011496_21080 [Polaromonas eurypsychrophila]